MKNLKKSFAALTAVTLVSLTLLTNCEKSQIKTSNLPLNESISNNSQQSARQNNSCSDLEVPYSINSTNLRLIVIEGNLRRPKVLECNNKIKACYCGFGVCEVKVWVAGHQIIGDRVMPNTDSLGIGSNSPVKDRAELITSIDGKYALIKFTRLSENDRQNEQQTFIIDDEWTLSAPGNSGQLCQTIPVQNAITLYPNNYGNLQTIINNLSASDGTGIINPNYFYFNANQLGLSSAVAIAIVSLN